jgi:hypothetical protein
MKPPAGGPEPRRAGLGDLLWTALVLALSFGAVGFYLRNPRAAEPREQVPPRQRRPPGPRGPTTTSLSPRHAPPERRSRQPKKPGQKRGQRKKPKLAASPPATVPGGR